MVQRVIGRRQLLGGALGAAVGAGVLSGCSAGPAEESRTGRVVLPSYVPYTAVQPDEPGLENGTAPYFARFPQSPPRFVTEKPANGGQISVMTILNMVPKKVESNRWWQAINDAVGADVRMDGAAIGDYPAKFQVKVASGEVPDISVVLPESTPALAGLLKAKFQDLTDFVSGDAVKDYPGLANIPTYAWRNCVFNGGIYLLPIQRFALNRCYLVRADVAVKAGVNPTPASGEELLETLRGLSNLKQNRWATAHVFGLLDLVNEMRGTPNKWAVHDGKFTKDYESEQFKESLGIVAKAWADNLIHPIAFEANFSLKIQALFNSGAAPFFPGVASWAGNASLAKLADPAADTVSIPVMKWDGSGPAGRWLNSGAPYLTAVKKGSAERVAEILRVINWFAAPWGTQENLLFRNGVKDHDYTVGSDGAFTQTDAGKAENPAGLIYAGSAPLVHYSAFPQIAKAEYDSEALGMRTAVALPTVGLVSDTDQNKGAALTKQMKDLQADIIQGRKPLSAWDDGVRTWKTNGGDTIRAEYEEALAQA